MNGKGKIKGKTIFGEMPVGLNPTVFYFFLYKEHLFFVDSLLNFCRNK